MLAHERKNDTLPIHFHFQCLIRISIQMCIIKQNIYEHVPTAASWTGLWIPTHLREKMENRKKEKKKERQKEKVIQFDF